MNKCASTTSKSDLTDKLEPSGKDSLNNDTQSECWLPRECAEGLMAIFTGRRLPCYRTLEIDQEHFLATGEIRWIPDQFQRWFDSIFNSGSEKFIDKENKGKPVNDS